MKETISAGSHRRFIYTEVAAALGVSFSLLFLFQFPKHFVHFPMDFILFVLFITAFGLISNVCLPIATHRCSILTYQFISFLECGNIWNWSCIAGESICQKLEANIIFCFLAAIFFFISGALGLWAVWRRQIAARSAAAEEDDAASIPWYHRDTI